MSKKVNFAMVNADVVSALQVISDDIFAHAMEAIRLTKEKKEAVLKVEKAIKDNGLENEAALRDGIKHKTVKDGEEIQKALDAIIGIEFRQKALSAWYKVRMKNATEKFRLDDIVECLGANNLEEGVKCVTAILSDVFGLEKVAVATAKKFGRRVYAAMDGQRSAARSSIVKGTLLTERSRREIKEVGVKAMCEYVAHTTNITLKTREDWAVEFQYKKDTLEVESYKTTER